eukprot:CAMPEP_0204250648 /NCGR_PEP_ID=MMETSP0361-20130328/100271_1 /ASSEMBLY_ACC=CAM_ASM_000343 /TAXON_ID=268821 /ORGANISM="Scrippsiella Hangoei, Strain SHTV-5" /LENGTH=199 /DNA_ID=CAMNT_0051223917 /DNA_START=85 /DNA_END=684 /DNA_ORIENTATION=+
MQHARVSDELEYGLMVDFATLMCKKVLRTSGMLAQMPTPEEALADRKCWLGKVEMSYSSHSAACWPKSKIHKQLRGYRVSPMPKRDVDAAWRHPQRPRSAALVDAIDTMLDAAARTSEHKNVARVQPQPALLARASPTIFPAARSFSAALALALALAPALAVAEVAGVPDGQRYDGAAEGLLATDMWWVCVRVDVPTHP